MTDYVLTGLVKRRALMTGEIEALHTRLKGLLADLESLDATILQFDPSRRVEAIRPRAVRPPADWANRGQMSRIALNILRQAAEPMTSRDVALELLVARAMNRGDQKLLRLMTKRVGVALRLQRENESVIGEQGPGSSFYGPLTDSRHVPCNGVAMALTACVRLGGMRQTSDGGRHVARV